MEIAAALKLATEKLRQKNIESAGLDALVLMMHAANYSREEIVFNPQRELPQNYEENFWQAIARREAREPVSHIIAQREFYGRNFFVSCSVLDPRPDSETLIEFVLEKFPDKNQKLQILEIGVGSGCLIISLLRNFLQASAIGLDISLAALEVAQKNAHTHKVENNLRLLESNLFEVFSAKNLSEFTENKFAVAAELVPEFSSNKFDLIISNPPYIKRADIENLADEVKCHEPKLALDGGVDGLDFYRRIAAQSAGFLKPAGLVVVEIGAGQKEEVEEIFAGEGFGLRGVKQDLAGVERVLGFVVV